GATSLQAEPAQVILIRHGEKDPDDPKDNHLSLRGRERAAALAPYLLEEKELTRFGPPVAIFAQKAADPKKNSVRPIETVRPLAATLKLEVLTPVERDDFPRLVEDVLTNPRYAGKSVLICWEHKKLAEMAEALVKHRTVSGAPKKWAWPDDRYD